MMKVVDKVINKPHHLCANFWIFEKSLLEVTWTSRIWESSIVEICQAYTVCWISLKTSCKIVQQKLSLVINKILKRSYWRMHLVGLRGIYSVGLPLNKGWINSTFVPLVTQLLVNKLQMPDKHAALQKEIRNWNGFTIKISKHFKVSMWVGIHQISNIIIQIQHSKLTQI